MHDSAVTEDLHSDEIMIDSARKRRKAKWILSVVAALLAGWIILSLVLSSVPIAYVSRAEQRTARDVVFGVAELSDVHTLTLRFERGGTVIDGAVEVGQEVKRGSLLMSLDTEELELEMERLQTQLEFENNLVKLPSDIQISLWRERGKVRALSRLVREGTTPIEELENAQRSLAQAEDGYARFQLRRELNFKSLENQLEKMRYSLDRMKLHSPIDGTIVEVMARKGDYIQQGQAVIRMIDERRLIVGLLSETDYDRVKVGYPVELRLKAFPNTVFQGEVAQILPTANPETQKFEIYIDAEMAPEQRVPGLTGEIIVIADSRPNAVVVPSQAVYEGHVLVVENRRIRKQPVTIGFSNLLEIEILEGLKPGEIVVTESNHQFKDGQLVRMEWEHLNPLRRFDN